MAREKVKPIWNYVFFEYSDLNRHLKASMVWLMFRCDYLSRPSPIHNLKHFGLLEEYLLSDRFSNQKPQNTSFPPTAVIVSTEQARVSHQNHVQAHPQQPKIPSLCLAPLRCRGLYFWLLGRLARDLDYINLAINLSILYYDLTWETSMARSSWEGWLDVAAPLQATCLLYVVYRKAESNWIEAISAFATPKS